MENVYLLRDIISIPAPLFKRGGHFVASFLSFCCRWRKTGQQGEDLLDVEPLVSRVRVMVLRARLGVDLSKPEWCFVRCLQFGQYLEELAHGVRPGHADILVLEHVEKRYPGPACSCHTLPKCSLASVSSLA